jgi:hypothetical protein
MKIAVFGTGIVGQVISEKLAALGHEVTIGTRSVQGAMERKGKDNFGRPPFSEWHKSHSNISVRTFNEAAVGAEVIVNATNGSGTLSALEQAGATNLSGKVLLDISNPLDFSKGIPPSLFICNTDSLGEQIQRTYPDLRVVKSLNTMNAYVMVDPSLLSDDHHVFMSGNDPSAKAIVKELLMAMGWKENNIIDMGDITTARGTEQLLPIWVRLWGVLQNPMFNFKIVIGKTPKAE